MIDEKKLIEDIEKEFDGVCTYDVSPSRAVQDFTDIVDRQPKVGVWIPVSERLPEKPNYYEVTVDFGSEQLTDTAYYSMQEARWGIYANAVTAWRERLPEPYKAGEQE